MPDGCLLLGPAPNQKARIIDEMDEGEVKRLRKVDEANQFLGAGRGPQPPNSNGLLPITATGQPSNRASAVMIERPCCRPISKTEPRSAKASRMGRIL